MPFAPGHRGGPGRPPKPKRPGGFGGVRLTRGDIARMRDGAHLLRLYSTARDAEVQARHRAAAVSIERAIQQWEARRDAMNARRADDRIDRALGLDGPAS